MGEAGAVRPAAAIGHRRPIAALVLGAVLIAAACGDADEPATTAPSVNEPPATSSSTAGPTTAAPTGAPPTTTTTVTSTTSTTRVPTTRVPTTTVPPEPPRVLLVGDSTLLAVESYGTEAALTGFEPVLEVASCRTLGVPSCGDPPLPPNSVETIDTADGPVDGVVIMAGYDEWFDTFPTSLEEVVASSRAQGAEWVLWLDYPEGVTYRLPDGRAADESFVVNNDTLERYAADPAYDDLVVAGWSTYAGRTEEWMSPDGIHLSPIGAYGVADYVSRWVAHLSGAACPRPLQAGGPVEQPCPSPDELQAGPDLVSLYSGTG